MAMKRTRGGASIVESEEPGHYRHAAYSVNVDLEVRGGPAGCLSHRNAGAHYDITVHPPGCRHAGRPRAHRPPKRYWRDFANRADARTFAAKTARESGALVRFCADWSD